RWSLRSFEKKLNRSHRSVRERRVRGGVMILGMLGLCGVVATSLSALTAFHHLAWLAEVALLALFLPLRTLHRQTGQWIGQVKRKELAAVREELTHATYRDAAKMDSYGLHRASIEYLASHFADRIASPVFWYVLLG